MPSPRARRSATTAATPAVKSIASPARSQPSRRVPSGHVTTESDSAGFSDGLRGVVGTLREVGSAVDA
ncbi:hypothetical protein [Promicromonospora sp. NPDC090134]|uniref:hypothetical protein n=1 Tax=Promicromonospora sp. NPDC090134 TaxID=3364408 RepID=UPI0038298691